MPLFEAAIVQNSSAVGTVSSVIWSPGNTSATTYGPLGSVPSGAVLKDVTIINTGTASVYVGSGSASAAATTGLLLPAGAQLTIQGYAATGGTTTNQIWGQTGTVGAIGAVTAGMASVASVV